jgi:hypothetical protein
MLQLSNGELRIDLLDPVADAARQGVRYCWGGYIWQVREACGEPLLTGPEWPNAAPSPFNGQGLPESFRHTSFEGRPLTWNGDKGVAVGAGELVREAGNVRLTSPCHWQVESGPGFMAFTTRHAAAGFDYELTRRIELAGRTVRSTSRLHNHAGTTLELDWFAHPFFALRHGVAAATFPVGTTLATNAGFALEGRELSQKRPFTRQDDGHMERSLRAPTDTPFHVTLAHPTLRGIELGTSFAPEPCVIWGNDRTFSVEPYRTIRVARGTAETWSITYRFLPPA